MRYICLNGAIQTLIDYLNLNRVVALTIAFFMARGIASMINKNFIIKFFGPDTPKHVSYLVASVSGCLLAVCSCTILPLFAGIYEGRNWSSNNLFVFWACNNVLAIFYSAALLDWGIGFTRAVFAILLSILIGLSMELIFKSHENKRRFRIGKADSISTRPTYQTAIFFLIQLAMLFDNYRFT